MVERVGDLGEQQQALVGAGEEALLLQDFTQAGELRLLACVFHRLGFGGQVAQFRDFLAHLFGVAGEG